MEKAQAPIILKIAEKGSDIQAIVREVAKDKKLIRTVLSGMASKKAREKFGCEKVIRFASEEYPAKIYPYFDEIASYLDSDNSFLKWGAIITISHLARVDKQGRIDAIFAKYFAPIRGCVMIAANNTIAGGGRIALAKPLLADRIAKEILVVQKAKYATTECKNVATGEAIDAFFVFFDSIRSKKAVMEFVRAQLENTRTAVRKKAIRFLKKYDSSEGIHNSGPKTRK
jgi:hypothetical protein